MTGGADCSKSVRVVGGLAPARSDQSCCSTQRRQTLTIVWDVPHTRSKVWAIEDFGNGVFSVLPVSDPGLQQIRGGERMVHIRAGGLQKHGSGIGLHSTLLDGGLERCQTRVRGWVAVTDLKAGRDLLSDRAGSRVLADIENQQHSVTRFRCATEVTEPSGN